MYAFVFSLVSQMVPHEMRHKVASEFKLEEQTDLGRQQSYRSAGKASAHSQGSKIGNLATSTKHTELRPQLDIENEAQKVEEDQRQQERLKDEKRKREELQRVRMEKRKQEEARRKREDDEWHEEEKRREEERQKKAQEREHQLEEWRTQDEEDKRREERRRKDHSQQLQEEERRRDLEVKEKQKEKRRRDKLREDKHRKDEKEARKAEKSQTEENSSSNHMKGESLSSLVDMKSLLTDAASISAGPSSSAINMGQGMVFVDSDSEGSDGESEDDDTNADSILSDPFSQLLASSFSNINMVKVAGDLEASFAGGSASSTGNMLSRNLREAREQVHYYVIIIIFFTTVK